MNTKTESYEQERAFVINRLSDELTELNKQLDAAKLNADSKEYRALLKTYTDTAKLHLRLVRENQTEGEAADPLLDFVG